MASATCTSDIITVVRDPCRPLGKKFGFNSNGEITKEPAVSISIGEANQHHVKDVDALAALLANVSEDIHAAIINSAFPLIPDGTPFLIMSESELEKRGIKRHDKLIKWPVTIHYNGEDWLVVGRFKEHTSPSAWILLDRDVDKHTPKEYAELDYDGWLVEVDKLIPGILKCARLRAHSSSARVSYNGKQVGGGNGHTWIQVANPEDINRLRTAVKARALDFGMAWPKPKHSRTTGEVIAQDVVSIIDWSVFTTGRLVFVGKPWVCDAV